MKVAIPRFGQRVAPCFEYTATIAIFTIRNARIVGQTDVALESPAPLDRFRLLRDQSVNVLICGGLQEQFEKLLEASKLRVISWVRGGVDEVLDLYLQHKLVPGSGRRRGAAGGGSPGRPRRPRR
ncbi:MAG: hypothetical protein HY815_15445 [Candidatus Riflebacteria bacterium]|nr:hypothetical protein [Candidatus Riflebacteria bacterium]